MSGEYIQYETMEGQVQRLGRVGGFAPGSYMSKCLTCGAAFEGDKRAISCLPCAVGKLQDARPTPTVEGGDDDALTVSYMLGRKEAADALASRDADVAHQVGAERKLVGLLKGVRGALGLSETSLLQDLPGDIAMLFASRDAEIERLRGELEHVEASIQMDHLRRIKAERDRLSAALGEAEGALEEAKADLSSAAAIPLEDPVYGAEVRALGERIGFGALMVSASAAWRAVSVEIGDPAGAEFVCSPCRATASATLAQVEAALSTIKTAREG